MHLARYKRVAALLLSVFFLFGSMGVVHAEEQDSLGLTAPSAFLMDIRSGRILYEKDADWRVQPASLAKIMTMELLFEDLKTGKVSLDDQVLVSEEAWRFALDRNLSRMFLEVNTRVSLEDLLYGIAVSSGNDASLVIAEHLAGSEEAFIRRMNEQAAKLGMDNTVFQNSHGLTAENQYTTARDMATLGQHLLLEHPDSIPYMTAKEFTYNNIRQPNYNGLVYKDDRITGIKTGHTSIAGYHLVASALEGETHLISVVLSTDSAATRENESLALLNYGFRNYETQPMKLTDLPDIPVYKGKDKEIQLVAKEEAWITITKNSKQEITTEYIVPDFLVAPIEKGQEIGEARIYEGDEYLTTVPLVAETGIEKGGFFKVLWDSIRVFFKSLVVRS